MLIPLMSNSGALTAFDVLDKVHTYYYEATATIIAAVVVMVGLFGWLIPFLTNKQYEKIIDDKVKDSEKKLKEEVTTAMGYLTDNLKGSENKLAELEGKIKLIENHSIISMIDDRIQSFKEEQEKQFVYVDGAITHVQSFTNIPFTDQLNSIFNTCKKYLMSGNYKFLGNALIRLDLLLAEHEFKKLSFYEEVVRIVEELSEEISTITDNAIFVRSIKQIKDTLALRKPVE